MTGIRFVIGLIFCLAFCFGSPIVGSDDLRLESRIRRPVDLAIAHGGTTLLVANSRSGTISVVDISSDKVPRVVGESKIVSQTGGMAANAEGTQFVVSDFLTHQLVALGLNGNVPQVKWEQDTIGFPTSVAFSPDDATIAVAGHWSRQLSLIPLTDGVVSRERHPGIIELDFVPGHLCWLDKSNLLVVDAYSSHLIVFDTRNLEISRDFAPAECRYGGVAVTRDRRQLLITVQVLNSLARSTRNDIHWGLLMSNRLNMVDINELLNRGGDDAGEIGLADYYIIGEPGNAKGDPGALWAAGNGSIAVTLGGVGQLGISVPGESEFGYVNVGRRPIAVTGIGKLAFVANQLDDTISIVDIEEFETVGTVSLGPTPKLAMPDLGQQLFFDASLSHDGWLSCHSCHPDGHTSDHLNDNFSDHSFGTPKRIISLLQPGGSEPFAWDGSRKSLSQQVRKSMVETMHTDQPPTDEHVAAVTAFLETLKSPPSVDSARNRLNHEAVEKGARLFESLDCSQCHPPPNYTTDRIFDVGLKDERGQTKFNPPSLLGTGQRDRFFHDARAESVGQVLTVFGHQLPRELNPQELSLLESFLRSL